MNTQKIHTNYLNMILSKEESYRYEHVSLSFLKFYKMISISSNCPYPCALYIFAKTLYIRPTLVWTKVWGCTNFGWFFLSKKRISSLDFNTKIFFGKFFMHLFEFNSSNFYTLHYWFWYLISNSKTCGSNFKSKSNLKIRFSVKAYYGE